MLEHLQPPTTASTRVVILGAAGFVGQTLHHQLRQEKIVVLPLTRQQIDLLSVTAVDALTEILQENDTLVVISAEAPCKNAAMLYRNIAMMHAVCEALQKKIVRHVIYISSDAVYADGKRGEPLTETSITAPTSLHGIMHLTREMLLQSVCTAIPLAILRPSLLYGANDPHNGYGPNRFRRWVAENKPIVLFGEGEERRDHVYIEDVATMIVNVIRRRSRGILNIATGQVFSFREIAEKIIGLTGKPISIQVSPRESPMPHNGYRSFDITSCRQSFPDFTYTMIDNGLRLSQS